ncbi:serine/threonine-protein kinase [Nocardia sp. NPDC051756]|uniref:serine/threonine-protein kinase n=1 Tax=Nocardia sp. NPDC051756 TaxID=3154751 RepID=UPI003417D8FE
MLRTGETFAGYTIERLLGRGGMGSVYLARHPRLPRLTAMKLLNPEVFHDNQIRTRFEREADLVARLDHPNIVTVFDRGVEDEQLWISMQYIDGTDAAAVDAWSLPPQRAVQIIGETAKALDFAHSRGVLHRDVKPANILLEGAGGVGERVFLTDFGIARFRDETGRLTQTGTFTATLAYASPEQLSGAILDHRSDQYSLACTLFRLLTGTVPFEATNPVAVIQGHLQTPPPPVSRLRPGLPVALDAVLAKAMAKRAEDRFDSCAEFAGAAWHALTAPPQFAPFPTVDQPSTVPPQPPTVVQQWGRGSETPTPAASLTSGHRRSRSNAMIGGVIGLLLVVGLIGSIAAFSPGGTGSAGPTTTVATPATSAPTTTRTGSTTPTTKPTTSVRPTPDRAQVSANAAALSNEFPDMLPKTTPGQSVQAGTGYNKAGCFAYAPGSAPPLDNDDPALGDWLVLWRCFGGPNKASFSFYLYNSPVEVRSALDGLPANDKITVGRDGHNYLNYTLRDSDERRPRMVTEFIERPQRAAMLMYSVGFIATESDFMEWWNAAPLN